MKCISSKLTRCSNVGLGKNTFASYEAIVSAYIKRHRNDARREIRFYKTQRSISNAIEKAALSVGESGKRHSHQRRIPRKVLAKWNKSLQKRTRDISKCKSFEQLLEIHNQERLSIRGIGKLTIYDTAQRIGAYLDIAPDKIYLHAGTKIGAYALGLGKGRESLLPNELPSAFLRLRPGEIEDCLCIFKDGIKKLRYLR